MLLNYRSVAFGVSVEYGDDEMIHSLLEGGPGFSHTPPTLTPSSYGNALQKRARQQPQEKEKPDEVSRLEMRLRLAADLEVRGLLTAEQKRLLKKKIVAGDSEVCGALDRYDAGDSTELERVVLEHDQRRQRPIGSGSVIDAMAPTLRSPQNRVRNFQYAAASSPRGRNESVDSTSSRRDNRNRAASIDLLAELDLDDGPLSDIAGGAPRKPPPSADCLGLPHDDQLMGFDMEMPFLPNVFNSAVVVASNHLQDYDEQSVPATNTSSSNDNEMRPRIVLRQNHHFRENSENTFQQQTYTASPSSLQHHVIPEYLAVDPLPSPDGSAASASSAHRGGGAFFSPFDDPPTQRFFGGKTAPGKDQRRLHNSSSSKSSSSSSQQQQTTNKSSLSTTTTTTTNNNHTEPTLGRRPPASSSDLSQLAPAVAYEGKISSTVGVPPPAPELNQGVAPPYEVLVNFPRAKTRAKIHCVMCGRYPRGHPEDTETTSDSKDDDSASKDGVVVIPRQNKDVCRDCDKALWRHNQTDFYFKWCKGCKRFRNLTAFAEKLAASKCDRCRERGRQGYQRRKGANGSPPGTPLGGSGEHHHVDLL